MESYAEECNELKLAYSNCFKKWLHEEYLPLSEKENPKKEVLNKFPPGFEPCKDLFVPYNRCLMKALTRDGVDLEQVEENLINQPLEAGLKHK